MVNFNGQSVNSLQRKQKGKSKKSIPIETTKEKISKAFTFKTVYLKNIVVYSKYALSLYHSLLISNY
jgi:hypothetical protein